MNIKRVFNSPVLLWIAVLLITSACAGQRRHNLSDAVLDARPIVAAEELPQANFKDYQTFSFHNGERHRGSDLHFILMVALESRGYTYVTNASRADFTVAIDGKSIYREESVPTRSYEVYRPYPNHHHGYWRHQNYYNHHYYGFGYYETVIEPGYEVSYYNPEIEIMMYEKGKQIWKGDGVGISQNQNLTVSSQFVVRQILDAIPDASNPDSSFWQVKERYGFAVEIMTNDGRDFYPTLIHIDRRSAASKAKLKKHDMITHVNGHSVQGKGLGAINERFASFSQETMTLTIKRMDKTLDVEMIPDP